MTSGIKRAQGGFNIDFYMIYLIGLAGFLFRPVRPVMKALTPAVLFITAFYAVTRSYYALERQKRLTFLVWCLAVVAVTIFLEALGVSYGLFFGEYKYGPVLGPAVFGVPLIIGVNWLIVIMGAYAAVRAVTGNLFIVSLVSGLAAFLFDFIMEPAAISLGFWEWEGGIPVKNYVSWFAITFVFAGLAGRLKLDISPRWGSHLLGAQFMFFIVIRVFSWFKVF